MNLLGYLVKTWDKGKLVNEKEFPGTAKGKRAAERMKKNQKQRRPGRPGQAVTVTPIFERTQDE